MSKKTKEYAFDVKLFACVRVRATSVAEAREAMHKVISCIDPSKEAIDDLNALSGMDTGVKITEVSISEDGESENELPFEINGEPA